MISITCGAIQIPVESFRKIEETYICIMESSKMPMGTIDFSRCHLKFVFENNGTKFYEAIKKDKQHKESNGK
ncbi:hypothetical protein CDLVIII_1313 [Clostridium sp. DL-VIII]|uniref:hypothetical protein n=1 Tax=Clostridium sp. DL-VIII TaxID=641107 RepID=UPI00023AF7B0|nr:hypothetical protein [Clostridium sp. DL-VIII]EHI98012.1 hypothetical protein CDLVIII_1313 [Clostridium sp. DL-VIII]